MRYISLIFFVAMVHAADPAASFEQHTSKTPSSYELLSKGEIIDKYTIDDKRSYTILYKKKVFVCEILHGSSHPRFLICWKHN